MVEYSEETTSDAVVKASSQNQDEQFNDFEDEREEQNLFPSRKIAKLLREKIFLVLRVFLGFLVFLVPLGSPAAHPGPISALLWAYLNLDASADAFPK